MIHVGSDLRPGFSASRTEAEHPLGLFGSMIEALQETGMAEPFPVRSIAAVTDSALLTWLICCRRLDSVTLTSRPWN
jgi:hypothetical protein